MWTTTTSTVTSEATDARMMSTAFDGPVRLRGAEQKPAVQASTPEPLDIITSPPRDFQPETPRRTRRDDRAMNRVDASPYRRPRYPRLRSKIRRGARDTRSRTGTVAGEDDLALAALDLFPNARPGVAFAHFYFKDSGDDTASEGRVTPWGRGSTDMGWCRGQGDTEVEVTDVESDPECASPGWTHGTKKARRRAPPAKNTVSETPLLAPKPRAPFREKAGVIAPPEREADPEFAAMRRAASPPLLGDNITFPRCESPETCHISTDLPFELRAEEEGRRDPTQKCGLWGGYCFNKEKGVLGGDKLTPPGGSGLWGGMGGGRPADVLSPPPSPAGSGMWSAPAPGPALRSQGLNPFQNVIPVQPPPPTQPQRAKPTLCPEEKEKRIQEEFTDEFVTQLYNYLSLGYPATARAFDGELGAAAGMSEDEVRTGDEVVLKRGHICDGLVGGLPVERRGRRWWALREYVLAWARGQESLEGGGEGVGAGVGVGVWRGRGSWRP